MTSTGTRVSSKKGTASSPLRRVAGWRVSPIPARAQKASTAKPLPENPDSTRRHSSALRRALRLSQFVAISALSSRVPNTALSTAPQSQETTPRSYRLPMEIAATLLLFGAQVISEYERIGQEQ